MPDPDEPTVDPKAEAEATLKEIREKPSDKQTPGDKLKAAVAEIHRRKGNVPPQAQQTADTVEALVEYCQRMDPPVDFYAEIIGDTEQDHTMIRALQVEQIGVEGSWTPADWLRFIGSMLTLGGITLGLVRGDGAQALLAATRFIDPKTEKWW